MATCSQKREKLDVGTLDSKDPLKQFECWLEFAKKNTNIKQPNAACLATSTTDGQPSCRMMSLHNISSEGFLFFTNHESKKAQELDSNPRASLCFYWDLIARQVVINGRVKKISEKESIDFFAQRSLESKIKTLSSDQDKVVKDRQVLLDRQSQLGKTYESTQNVPTPLNWNGYLFVPDEFDFWQGDLNDLDDRIRFRKRRDHEDEGLITRGEGDWVIERLSP